MKKYALFLALALLPMLASAQECENLQGAYSADVPSGDEPFDLVVVQKGCDSVQLLRSFYRVPMQYNTNAVFDGKIYDEDMLGYVFKRRYFWDNGKAFYEGTLLDASGNFQANIKGELRLADGVLKNIMNYHDENGNYIVRDVETFVPRLLTQ